MLYLALGSLPFCHQYCKLYTRHFSFVIYLTYNGF